MIFLKDVTKLVTKLVRREEKVKNKLSGVKCVLECNIKDEM